MFSSFHHKKGTPRAYTPSLAHPSHPVGGTRLSPPSYNRKRIRPLIVLLLMLMVAACAQGVKYHEREIGGGLNFFTWNDERQLGQQVLADVSRQMKVENDPVVLDVLYRIGHRLNKAAVAAGFRPVPWEYYYINTEDVNAFAAPGGYLFFLRGLLFRLEHEDELAAIMGHEMGHVYGRHSTKRLSQLLLAAGVILATGEALKSKNKTLGNFFEAFGGIGLFFYSLNFSRNQERESDFIGFHLMRDAGYNPDGMARAFERLLEVEKKAGGGGPAFLSTHPGTRERIQTARKRLKSLGIKPSVTPDSPDFRQMLQHLRRKS